MIFTLPHLSPTSHISLLIDNLGNSADEIAETLAYKRSQGVRNTVRFLNPLVRHLQNEFQVEFGERAFMDVIKGDILRIAFLNGEKAEVSLSDAAVDFLDAFDRGEYPELEKK
jgi:hypothetical protein